MSIIIRLQNLPFNAKSADIRHFFGGLRIPDGGVHILGGDKGDAFIAFMSDEDGRLAMRKDGGKIKDSRVKLFLSSRMEMQHEVEKLTKSSLVDASSSKTSSKSHLSGDEVIRGRSSEKRRHSRSRSPYNYRDWGIDKSRTVNDSNQRSRSPIGERSYSSKRRKSRSPKRYVTSHRSSSSDYKSVKQEKRLSPEVGSSFVHEMESESKSSDQQSVSQSQLQADLERRITEELEKNDIYRMIIGDNKPPDRNVERFNMSDKEDFPFNIHQPYQQSYGYECEPQNNFMPFLPPYDADRQFEGSNFNPGFSGEGSRSEHDVARPIRKSFFVLLSGFDPQWNFKKVQIILKGYFAPQGSIRFQKDRDGRRTGKVVVKVANKDDYENILKNEEVTLDDHKIKLSKCNFALMKKLFPEEFTRHSSYYEYNLNQDFCYLLKGIPFECKNDNIVQFFNGCEIVDILIIYREDGRASGTGFVCFKTRHDFEGAYSQNGKKIFHRYIEMLPCSLRHMLEAKKKFCSPNSPVFNAPSVSSPSFNSPSFIPPFTPYNTLMPEKRLPMTGRPLCALLTGLPPRTTAKKITTFFSKSDLNPDAIHLTVNHKRLSDGRAFVEFSNFLDFDAALKFHGEKLDDNIICVKQILFDEMVKILDTQKARHHFNTPAPAVPPLNVPERVPYLWEPPDAGDFPSRPRASDSFKGTSFDKSEAGRSRFQDELVPLHFHFSQMEKPFYPNEKPTLTNEYFDPYSKRDMYSNSAEIFPSSMIPQNNDLNMYERMSHPESSTKEQFRMDSNKNDDIDMKISDLFDSFKKYEDNIKTSRLSPDNEAALLQFLSSKKSSDFDVSERRSRSPDRKKRSYHVEDRLGRTEYKKDKIYESGSSEESRSRDEQDSRPFDDWKADSSGSFLPDRIESEKKSVGCVVHISNVSISACTGDLANFLTGFDYFENTLIRRYTDANEPTNDVRVTFLSRREAERAVRVLDKHYLHNSAVRLNILS